MSLVSPPPVIVASHSAARLLRTAIEATARSDPGRVALSGHERTVTYGELVGAVAQPVAERAERRALAATGLVDDVLCLLAATSAGHSALMLDGRGTSWEMQRSRSVFASASGPAAPALGLCTSGTNGLPKVVELDWESVLRNAASFADAVGYGPRDVLWVTSPLAHLYGLGAGVIAGLLRGATVMIASGAQGPEEFARRLVDGGVTVLLSVPFLARQYLREFARDRALARASSLRATIAAGEPVAEELIVGWREATGTPLLSHYGLTEGGHVTVARGTGHEGVGRRLPDVDVRIAENGAIHVRRPAPARPYRVIGEAPDPDGWCVTGDLGHIDDGGNLHITGRASDRINVAGKKVDPTEVEQALRSCRGVADCAVAGVRQADREQVVAFVVADGVSDGELRAELGTLLSSYKLPRRFVRSEEIPRTLTGKVRRGQLIATLRSRPSPEPGT